MDIIEQLTIDLGQGTISGNFEPVAPVPAIHQLIQALQMMIVHLEKNHENLWTNNIQLVLEYQQGNIHENC